MTNRARLFSAAFCQSFFDVEASQISRIELGKINTSITHAKKIANALGMDLKELFDFDM
ncbi:MAG: helix-turn-helix transcriptional regulator [Saprospiraceae bacterium]|nr:helix-turn-helix transcriptional regulator [Saprospiraceae bacterium]